jgi:hypothetical protein
VSDGETPAQRRRRQRANWTEGDLIREENEAFARTSYWLRLGEKLRASLPASKWSNRPPGRPVGSATFTLADLEAAVDRIPSRDKLTQRRLAAECNIGLSTLTTWLSAHPEVWPQLKARGRRPR